MIHHRSSSHSSSEDLLPSSIIHGETTTQYTKQTNHGQKRTMKLIIQRFLLIVVLCCPIHGILTIPTSQPSNQPSIQPSCIPTTPSSQPSNQPSSHPTRPSGQPTTIPTTTSTTPSSQPTGVPTTSSRVFNYAIVTQSINGISTTSPLLFVAFSSASMLAFPSSSSFNIMKASSSNSSNSISSVVIVYTVDCPITSRALLTLLQSISTNAIMNSEFHKSIPYAYISLPSSIILLPTPTNTPTIPPSNNGSLIINGNSKVLGLIIGLVVGLGIPCIFCLIYTARYTQPVHPFTPTHSIPFHPFDAYTNLDVTFSFDTLCFDMNGFIGHSWHYPSPITDGTIAALPQYQHYHHHSIHLVNIG